MLRSRLPVLLLAVASSPLVGCGASTKPGAATATGVVALDSKPVAGANVIFYPASAANPALACQAVTDEQGRFQMQTHVGAGKFEPGIAPGAYVVAITKLDTAGITTTLGPPKSLLPRKYNDPKTSKLAAVVALDRENNFEFNLKPE